ncbi:hypothetical protein J4461_03900 [Candidatus Pacearchaeota archaeon]|nr:hypothetical protein [Candidatus Pacearchaeota archaeon]
MKPFQIYLAALIAINLILSLYLVYSDSSSNAFCIIGKNCDSVQNSAYGNLFGVKLSWIGVVAFTFLLILYYLSHRSYTRYKLFAASALLGAILAAYFIIIQAFVLKQVCSSCIVIDAVMLIITGMSVYEYCLLRKYY